jgi:hypothetical protein
MLVEGERTCFTSIKLREGNKLMLETGYDFRRAVSQFCGAAPDGIERQLG